MVGVGTAIPRAIGLIALLALVVVALRGYLPGDGGPHVGSPPTLVALALMPVLALVSIVILLAGVITSRHRLPLALPETDRGRDRQPLQLGRLGLLLVLVVAATVLVAALGWAVYQLMGGHGAAAPQSPAAQPTPVQPTSVPTPTPAHPLSGEPQLSGGAMLLVGIAAGMLVLVAIAGLVVVAIGARRRPPGPAAQAPPAHTEAVVSLAQVAEMGLAAMIASGRDARTAIIACYSAMERGLSGAREVAPLISDTPSEVLARAFDRGVLHDASARELVTLFEEARFSPHSMLEWQRMRAEQLLRIVLKDLQGEQL